MVSTQRIHSKVVNMRLPESLVASIDDFCHKNDITRTYFFATMARKFLKKRGLIKQPKIINTWGNNPFEIPLDPETK